MTEKKPKVLFEEFIKCPHCKKKLIIKKTKKILEAAVPTETEEKVIVDKDSQTELPKVGDSKKKNKG